MAIRLEITKVDLDKDFEQSRLIKYLQPYEEQALFLLGNLQNKTQAVYYIAIDNKQLVGVCGYYPIFRSCSIFSENATSSRELAKVVLKTHQYVISFLGMEKMVKPINEEFEVQGRKLRSSLECNFFELRIMENFRPFFISHVTIRSFNESDINSVASLQHLVYGISMNEPISPEDRVKVRANPVSFCLEVEGKVVATASTNGLAIHAFQILAVATDPAYRGRGYAKAICSFLIQEMQRKGAQKACLFTGKENIAAKQCYLDLGFQITDNTISGQ